jgi:hypothetical protein
LSNLSRKIRRRDLVKQRKVDRAYYGTCDEVTVFTEGEKQIRVPCELDAVTEHVCLTCEALALAGKPAKGPNGEVFRRKVCPIHRGMALEAVKKHALVAHPVNMLKMAYAVLKGDR